MSEFKINKNIIPINFPDRGEHPEKIFQHKLRNLLASFGLKEIESKLIVDEFTSFDQLLFPQFSSVRTKKNVIYVKGKTKKINKNLFNGIAEAHLNRFGYQLNRKISERSMLLSHTTASIVDYLIDLKPMEIFIISKTFRAKKERREKTQVDFTLINRTLPEVMAFIDILYSQILNKKIKIEITPDFYYFAEPSFSFKAKIGENKIKLGSGGFMRNEILNLINKGNKTRIKSIVFIGLPYQKLLNLSLGKKYDDWGVDYNKL